MKTIDIIMNILENEGMDKRLKDNVEAKKQIESEMASILYKRYNVDIKNMNQNELEQNIKGILEKRDKVPCITDEYPNMGIVISGDGSLSLGSIRREENAREDTNITYAISNDTNDLIVSTQHGAITKYNNFKNQATSFSIQFDRYNSHGLQMQHTDIAQSYNDAFNSALKMDYNNILSDADKPIAQVMPATMLNVTRDSKSLNYQGIEKYKRDVTIYLNANKMNSLLNEFKNKAFDGKMDRVQDQSYHATSCVCNPAYPNALDGYSDFYVEQFNQMSEEEQSKKLQNVYADSVAHSKAFKDTLIEKAKENAELKAIAESLNIDIEKETTENKKENNEIIIDSIEKDDGTKKEDIKINEEVTALQKYKRFSLRNIWTKIVSLFKHEQNNKNDLKVDSADLKDTPQDSKKNNFIEELRNSANDTRNIENRTIENINSKEEKIKQEEER